MKRTMMMVAAACSIAMLVSVDADARRLGGGRTVGAPRDVATQRQAVPPQQSVAPAPVAPAGAAAAAKAPAAAAPPTAQPGWRRFMGPIAGIAAGLGIAALMSHLGMSEAFGHFLLIALMVIAAIVVLRLIFRRPATPDARQGLQYAGAGAGSDPSYGGSAQPGYGSATNAGAGSGSGSPTPMFGGAAPAVTEVTPGSAKPLPPGFDPEPFLQQAKVNFTRLQAAFDTGDTSMLRDVTTPDMFDEISRDLAARGTHHATEIVQLNAEILEVVTEDGSHWATVRFHGLTREDGIETPQAFDEAWNLKKVEDGSTGWLLAGIQQL